MSKFVGEHVQGGEFAVIYLTTIRQAIREAARSSSSSRKTLLRAPPERALFRRLQLTISTMEPSELSAV